MTKFAKDLTERVAMTFLFSFLSVFSLTDMSTAKDAALAGAAAAASVIKGLLAGALGDTESASLVK